MPSESLWNFFLNKIALSWVMDPKMVQNWPKMPFFLISWNYFQCFCWNILQTSTEFHNGSWFKVSGQKNLFCRSGLPGGSGTAPNLPKIAFLSRFRGRNKFFLFASHFCYWRNHIAVQLLQLKDFPAAVRLLFCTSFTTSFSHFSYKEVPHF